MCKELPPFFWRRLQRSKVVLAALAIHFLLLIHGASLHFANVDEVAHLPSGVSHWKFERFDMYRVNPPLVRLVASFPAWSGGADYNWADYSTAVGQRSEFMIGLERLEQVKLGLHRDFLLPRITCLIFPLLAVLSLHYWVGRVCRGWAATLVCVYCCFCPNLLAHAQTIVPDVGSVAMGILACYAAWRYTQNPTFVNSLWMGFFLGAALLTKMTWIIGLVTLPAIATLVIRTSGGSSGRKLQFLVGDGLVVIATALLLLNTLYLFQGTGKPLHEYEFCSDTFHGLGCDGFQLGNRLGDSWLGNVPVPVPRDYLLGIDYLKYEVEEKYWSFLMGEWKFGSWPHYYVMTTLFKTPEPTLLAALIGLGVLVVGIRRKMVEPKVISMFLFLIIPAAVCFASVSLQGGFNHHHRYVLMIYPPMFALAAYVASPVAVQLLRFRLPLMGPTKRSIAIPLAVTLVALSAASSLRVHPYYTSYFNTLSGGPENGWRLLGFSNIDWGQDILEVDKWLKAHPDRRPLVMDLDYFGMNGNLFDVPTTDPPQLPKHASIDEVRRSITETQWWIISVKKLYNYPGHHGLEYLQQLEPVDKIAYAYHVYRIDPLPLLEPATDTMQESDHSLDGTPTTPRP
jgi:hypothetical protein